MHEPSLSLLSIALLAAGAQAQTQPEAGSPVISVEGQDFYSWSAYVDSPLFEAQGRRCFTAERDPDRFQDSFLPPGDCNYNRTIPDPVYDPGATYRIPVVVHIMMNTSGQGAISDAKVQSQIDILNEDFKALAGSNGEPGTNGEIEFYLATQDPQGNPTTGIFRYTDNQGYQDNGSYWSGRSFDTNRYCNIYTNQASGALGYVPDLPQGGIAGQSSDRIVVLWSSFGRNAPIGPPYDQGRTTTHEMGHYLGLFHTFDGSCSQAVQCNNTGDTICDTPPELSSNFGCPPVAMTCGITEDPIHNYMDYSDDLCMWEFTVEQVRRMRCTMNFYRPAIYDEGDGGLGDNYCTGAANSAGAGSVISALGSASVGAQDLTLVADGNPANVFGIFYAGPNQINVAFGDGFRCVGGQTFRVLPIAQADAGGSAQRPIQWQSNSGMATTGYGQTSSTLNFQFWYRDQAAGGAGFNFSDALEISMQP